MSFKWLFPSVFARWVLDLDFMKDQIDHLLPVSQFVLPPGQFAPQGQAIPGYLAAHPGYLHPPGASCPGRFILPPAQNK